MNDLEVIDKSIATMNSLEVADIVSKQHAHLIRGIDTYIEYISANPKLDSLDFFIESTYVDTQGKERRCFDITKKGCEFIAHKLTGKKGALFTASYINRFHEMEKKINQIPSIQDQAQVVTIFADNLKVNEASKLLMFNKFCKANNIDTEFLPVYSDEEITKSLTQLLKENDVKVGAVKFNKLLLEQGYLEIKTRPSTKTKKIKEYKMLTEKGLEYGKNLISPHNQKEVQPHYFENRFMKLVDLVLN